MNTEEFSPHYFPVSLRVDGARVVVVGGGEVAANKTRLLVSCRAIIEVIAAELGAEMALMHKDGAFRLVGAEVDHATLPGILAGARLVYAATDDRQVNHHVAAVAGELNIPVCVVDDPEPSTFITPAIVNRHPVQVAISTAGAAPVLARRLREQIEALVPAGYGQLASYMRAHRPKLRVKVPDMLGRRRVWEDFLDGSGAEAALSGQTDIADAELDRLIGGRRASGEVWLVGAGPGNPDLLTLGALRLMQNADCVLYDNLLPGDILDRVRRDADRIFVGKERKRHSLPQEEINAEMVRRAKLGQRVLRLKGGDPFVFGRGGEEIEALMSAGVRFRVLPGITAATGCAAFAGIPLTHRDCAQSCLFLTGHARADGELDLAWETIALRNQTVVIYMGLTALRELCIKLQEHGLPSDWPAAVIEKGTQADQRVVTGDLQSLPELARSLKSPSLVMVGEVVKHRVISAVSS